MPGFWELILILAVVTLLFGGKKLPQLGGAVGEAIRNFKRGIKDEGGRQIEAANAQANVEVSLENNKQA
ncbi:MAG: twin-arginine translocase TatA/TatE family subunit [Proteobacteria bacterium]|nr:twin-arginine translocase TatA/TatE family subunit [Pseudomonadota bacterium]